MKCPYCDQEHPDDAKFCINTGQMLPQGERAAPPEPEAQSESSGEMAPQPAGQVSAPEAEAYAEEIAAPEQPAEELVSVSQLESLMAEPEAAEPTPEISGEQVVEVPAATPSNPRRPTRRWVIGGCVGVPVVILLLLVALALIDPFKLHLWGRINGRYDAAVEVMPANTGMYVGINIGNAILTHADRVITPFTTGAAGTEAYSSSGKLAVLANPAKSQQTDPYGDLFQVIEDETGMKFPEDITPWVGQYAGIGVLGLDGADMESMVPEGELFAVEVRNLSRADAFLETMMANMKTLHSIDYSRETYKNITIYNQYLGTYPSFSYCRSGRLLMGASNEEILKDAIDRQNGQALVVEEEYSQLVSSRARDWSASVYLSPDILGSASAADALGTNGLLMTLANPYANLRWNGMMLNASVIRQGARLDMYINVDTSGMSSSAIQDLQAAYTPATQVIGMLPEDAVIYFASPQFDQFVEVLFSNAFSDQSEQSAYFEALDEGLGFSLQEDLLNHLTGEWALYAVPSAHGLLADQMGLNMAINLLVQTDTGFDLQPVTEGLNNLGPFSGLLVNSQQQNGITYYEISSLGDSNPVLAFGAANGYFTLGTDRGSLQIAPQEDSLLISASSYKKAVDALPNGMQPSVYLDLENLFANLREGMPADEREYFNESISAIEPVSIVAGAGRWVGTDIMHASIVVILADK
jgi:hypothetical protein